MNVSLIDIFRREVAPLCETMLVRRSVGRLIRPHDEILQKLLTWKTGYVAIASRRGEGRENRFASGLVMVARSCFV
jgi:hypothetical protein